jgi:hypothetical protein
MYSLVGVDLHLCLNVKILQEYQVQQDALSNPSVGVWMEC